MGLRLERLVYSWGSPWNMQEVSAALRRKPAWVWAVHLETSTGVQNPLAELVEEASKRSIPVAADCVSSLGAVPLPQQGLWMASGVSGKALASYAGLSFAFASREALEQTAGARFPSSLDVGAAVRCPGPQFTIASPQLMALREALTAHATAEASESRYRWHQEAGRSVGGSGNLVLCPWLGSPMPRPVSPHSPRRTSTFASSAGLPDSN